MWFKSCDKCGGDFYIEEDGRFRDLVCLQCGFRPKSDAQLISQLERQESRPRANNSGR